VVNIYAAIGDITITEGIGNTMEFRAEKDVRRGELEEWASWCCVMPGASRSAP